MADFTPKQKRIVDRYYEHHDTIQSGKLGEIVSELWLAEDEKTATKLWGKAQVALMRMGVDATRVATLVNSRDVDALAKLVNQADAGAAPGQAEARAKAGDGKAYLASVSDGRSIQQMRREQAAAAGTDSLEEENLKKALKQFRRKLKTMRRDDESKLGSKYVTSGRASSISAIEPPKEYPAAVWDKLVELKRLCKAGQGMYELPEDAAKRPKR